MCTSSVAIEPVAWFRPGFEDKNKGPKSFIPNVLTLLSYGNHPACQLSWTKRLGGRSATDPFDATYRLACHRVYLSQLSGVAS